ncbi:UNVERIFIED_ORG: phage protein D [Burkholderia sp. 1263]
MNKASASVAAVRGAVKLSNNPDTPGVVMQGVTAFEVENNTYSNADTFSCTFSANALPESNNAKWFSQQSDMYLELFMGVPPDPTNWVADDLKSWVYGQTDKIGYDPITGIITVTGRDLARVFIDAKTTEKFQNKTSSQVAQILAARHGLTAKVVATKTPIGKLYEIDHEHMNDAQTEWDILTHLARVEQYAVYVRGKTLYFQPKPDPSKVSPYPIVWTPPDSATGFPTCAVTGLKLDRALTISRGITVVVRSFNDAAQKTFTATYPPKQKTSIKVGGFGAPQTYYYDIANLTQQAVVARAQSKYAELIQHEMLMSFEIPGAGNDSLDVNSLASLIGTGTAWDQTYFPESLKRSMSFSSGYTLEVHAKNHSPDSQEAAQ